MGLAIFLFFFLPEFKSIHLPLLVFIPATNLIVVSANYQDFCLKVLDNKLAPFPAPKDMDAYKMGTIENEFNLYACEVLTKAIHFGCLLWSGVPNSTCWI